MNEALELIERHAIEFGLTPAQVRDRFVAGVMAARVLLQEHGVEQATRTRFGTR